MRTTITTTLLLALALVASGGAWAQSANDVELTDPAGDAGPAGVGLGAAASDFDLRRVDLVTDGDSTHVEYELSSFDLQPRDVFFGFYYEVDGGFVVAGYGEALLPFPPFLVEGYWGCHIEHDGDQAEGQEAQAGEACKLLEGRALQDAPGFEVDLPTAWAPAGSTLTGLEAAVYAETFAPYPVNAPMWMFVWPNNALDLATGGQDHEVPEPTEPEPFDQAPDAADPSAAISTSGTGATAPSVGALAAAGLGLLALAGVSLRRR